MARPRSEALKQALIDIKNGMSITAAANLHGAQPVSIYRLIKSGEIPVPPGSELHPNASVIEKENGNENCMLQPLLLKKWGKLCISSNLPRFS
ncbi:MAG: hypothetical protein KGI54_17250 [Pseudomonadota bacterium]|nr:hypothetical protein [Pseudomonadota bacterium]